MLSIDINKAFQIPPTYPLIFISLPSRSQASLTHFQFLPEPSASTTSASNFVLLIYGLIYLFLNERRRDTEILILILLTLFIKQAWVFLFGNKEI
ncbi:hypothetical protein DFH27DRAFT_14081 [Peziza echinospora]|nr:hypothetical protein DFH27DRAFT_14081 [Peziza echinospora]